MTVREDPISKQEFYELKRQVRELATQSPLRSASITEGRLRVGGSAILLIDSDGGVVIEGSLDGDGNITWTGAALFEGTFTAKGTTRFEGDTTQVGPFHIEGATDLKGDFAVKSGGKITVEGSNPIVLSQIAGAAQMQLGAAKLIGAADGFVLGVSDRLVYGGIGGVTVQGGANSVSVNNATGTAVVGALTTTGNVDSAANVHARGNFYNQGITTDTSAANVFIHATSGRIYRVSSATRFKSDIRELELDPALLGVRVKDWLDAGQVSQAVDLFHAPRPFTREQDSEWEALTIRRVPGVIAEDVEAAGAGAFSTYAPDGQLEGVQYDRLALARTQILADQLGAQQKQIDALQRQVNELIELLAA
ncbi:hypothetical protein ASC66_01285 [Leifsonia sp. Root4]|uniref:hypothetical protein n=1 Tax=Leifsonia sp. Root4 TaxID=1736525 RepID=UPI0006F6C449|nr:hypothetical protein [Leifsonia sp. Root4]KQW07662.1 hypothetical protein ASC66_01285 [Leifsonia sp. Root4]